MSLYRQRRPRYFSGPVCIGSENRRGHQACPRRSPRQRSASGDQTCEPVRGIRPDGKCDRIVVQKSRNSDLGGRVHMCATTSVTAAWNITPSTWRPARFTRSWPGWNISSSSYAAGGHTQAQYADLPRWFWFVASVVGNERGRGTAIALSF